MSMINTWPGWECIRQIGAGSFGKVYEIEKKENGLVRRAALKVMSVPSKPEDVQELYDSGLIRNEEDARTYINSHIENLSQEFRVMAALRGTPEIVTLEDHMTVAHQGWVGADILIRMELLTPLTQYMRSHILEEKDIIRLGTDICSALAVCHEKVPPILHRDIKAANIMVDSAGNFKLGDFGVARVMEGTKSVHTKAGTEDYMAPEVLQMKGYRTTADIYSLGILLYKLLNNNRNPFLPPDGSLTANMQMNAKTRRLNGEAVPPPLKGSPALKAVIQRALAYVPGHRYHRARDFKDALEQCLVSEETVVISRDSNPTQSVLIEHSLLLSPEQESNPAAEGGMSNPERIKDIIPAENVKKSAAGDPEKGSIRPAGPGSGKNVVYTEVLSRYNGPGTGSTVNTPGLNSGANTSGHNTDINTAGLNQGGRAAFTNHKQTGRNTGSQGGTSKGKKKNTGILLNILIAATAAALVILVVLTMYREGRKRVLQGSQQASVPVHSVDHSGNSDSGNAGSAQAEAGETMEIYSDSLAMIAGDSMRLSLNTGKYILDGTSAGIGWSSSDPEICSVNGDGELLAAAPGNFTVTANYEGKYAALDMSVVEVDTAYGAEIAAEPAEVHMEEGGSAVTRLHFTGNLPEVYTAIAYDSAGMMLSTVWGSPDDDQTCDVTFVDTFSDTSEGSVTILLYDKNEWDEGIADHLLGSTKISVIIDQ